MSTFLPNGIDQAASMRSIQHAQLRLGAPFRICQYSVSVPACRILYINCCQILWSAYLSNLSAGRTKTR